jgi:hypothetical protein
MSATSEWVTPPTRPELIESLVSGVGPCLVVPPRKSRSQLYLLDRYNPSNVGILEDYLYHQIRSREYDCLANLAILKLCFCFRYCTWIMLILRPGINSIPICTIRTLWSTSWSRPSHPCRFPTSTSLLPCWTTKHRTRTWKNRTLFPASFPISPTFIASCSNAASPHFGRYTALTR